MANKRTAASSLPRLTLCAAFVVATVLISLFVSNILVVFTLDKVLLQNSDTQQQPNNNPQEKPQPQKPPPANKPPPHQQPQQNGNKLPPPPQQRQRQQQQEQKKSNNNNNGYDVHIVVSSGCNALQDWQMYAFFHTIYALDGFDGNVTRVASCETAEQAQALRKLHEEQIQGPMSSKFRLHTTPDYAHLVEPKYNFFNKPFGIRHWMEHGLGFGKGKQPPAEFDKTIVVILDPDQFLLRPFVQDYTHEEELWMDAAGYRQVTVGQPMAAVYAFGGGWIHKLNVDTLLGLNTTDPGEAAQSGLRTWTTEWVAKHLAVGPPYVAVASDTYRIVRQWSDFVVSIYHQMDENGQGKGTFMAEMYGYSTAAAHLNLPHQASQSFMISQPDDNHFEAWVDFIDRYLTMDPASGLAVAGQNLTHASHQVCHPNMQPMPHVLHFCQRFYLGHYFFSKYQVPKGKDEHDGVFLSCEHPLFEEPPRNVAQLYNFGITRDGERHELKSPRMRLRMAYGVCQMLPRMNAAAAFYKQHHCPAGQANFNKTFVFETHEAKKARLAREAKAAGTH